MNWSSAITVTEYFAWSSLKKKNYASIRQRLTLRLGDLEVVELECMDKANAIKVILCCVPE